MNSTLLLKWFVLIISLGGSIACQKSTSSDVNAVGSMDARWKDPRAIPVCWMQSDAFHAPYQAEIERVVTTDYDRVGLKFVGWRACTTEDRNRAIIRIGLQKAVRHADGTFTAGCSFIGPAVQALSKCYSTVPGANLWINYDLRDRGATALHEIGHAIGLHHEHERVDATGGACGLVEPSQRTLSAQGQVKFLTAYDPKSIMDYCSGAGKLSDLDIVGIQEFYNIRPGNAPRPKASCADAFGNTFAHGSETQFDGRRQLCNDGLWDAGAEINPAPAPKGCVGVYGTVYQDGVRTTYQNQYYTCDRGSWRHDGPVVPVIENRSCIGVDRREYAHGVLTLYRGQYFMCDNGNWRNRG